MTEQRWPRYGDVCIDRTMFGVQGLRRFFQTEAMRGSSRSSPVPIKTVTLVTAQSVKLGPYYHVTFYNLIIGF